jgi:hypothetical protein
MLSENKGRRYAELGGYLALLAFSSVVAWFLPDEYNRKSAFVLLSIGVAFDLLSLFYHVMTIATGKFMSGFPLVGLIFYVWFLLASRFSLVGWGETEMGRVLLFKLADLAGLAAFHAFCQLPIFLQKPRSENK